MNWRTFLLALVVAAARQPSAPVHPVFDCSHENFAWGHVVSGRVVDRDGTIFSYARRGGPARSAVESRDGKTFLTEPALASRFEMRERVGAIAAEDVKAQAARIVEASAGVLARADGGARDAGSHVCVGYAPDPPRHRVEVVTLGTYGSPNDTRIRNSSPAAQALLEWLVQHAVAK